MDEFDEKLISNRIRIIRKSKGLTIKDLADKINMTKAYVSKLERSDKAAPISTLYKIGKALEVDLNFLITGNRPEGSRISFVKKEEQISVVKKRRIYDYIYYALAFKRDNKLMEPFIIEAHNKKEIIPFSHLGEEFNYLLKGEAEIYVDGKIYKMKEGDSLYFDSMLPHYARSTTDKNAYFLLVNTLPDKEAKNNHQNEQKES